MLVQLLIPSLEICISQTLKKKEIEKDGARSFGEMRLNLNERCLVSGDFKSNMLIYKFP